VQDDLPLCLRLEGREPLSHRLGPVVAAVEDRALPVRRPVRVDGEEHVVPQKRLHVALHRLGVAAHAGIERPDGGRLGQDRLPHPLVVLIGRHGQKAKEQPVEQVEPRAPEADVLVELRPVPKKIRRIGLMTSRPTNTAPRAITENSSASWPEEMS
jgi:hypothetical protein